MLKMVLGNKRGQGQKRLQLIMELLVTRVMVLANVLARLHVPVRNIFKNCQHAPLFINIQKQWTVLGLTGQPGQIAQRVPPEPALYRVQGTESAPDLIRRLEQMVVLPAS